MSNPLPPIELENPVFDLFQSRMLARDRKRPFNLVTLFRLVSFLISPSVHNPCALQQTLLFIAKVLHFSQDNSNGNMDQPQHRRDPTVASKRSIIGPVFVICFLAVASCLRASFTFHKTSSAPTLEIDNTNIDVGALTKTAQQPQKHGQGNPSSKGWESKTRTRAMKNKQIGKLDFVIAGFPKTGTTSLRYLFQDHPETDMASVERCSIANPMTSNEAAFEKLQQELAELSPSPNVKRAIKCPNIAIHAHPSIVRLEQHASDAKIVIGVRHPIEMMQSYYNYRITELYNKLKHSNRKKNAADAIPPLERLIGVENEWKRVSTDSTRFELFLMQFGKARVEAADLQDMMNRSNKMVNKKFYQMAIKPNRFSIFLYTLEQLEDTGDTKRSEAFRSGLQNFLGLKEPLKPVGRENLNGFVGKNAHPETVDICLPKYNSMRRFLLKQGARSAEWIEQEFLRSPDVVVANRDHFLESIRSWTVDPCDGKATSKKQPSDPTQAVRVGKPKRVFVGRNRKIEVIPVPL